MLGELVYFLQQVLNKHTTHIQYWFPLDTKWRNLSLLTSICKQILFIGPHSKHIIGVVYILLLTNVSKSMAEVKTTTSVCSFKHLKKTSVTLVVFLIDMTFLLTIYLVTLIYKSILYNRLTNWGKTCSPEQDSNFGPRLTVLSLYQLRYRCRLIWEPLHSFLHCHSLTKVCYRLYKFRRTL